MKEALLTPRKFRERFPIFERKVFLNSCSKGALSRAVEGAYQEYLESWRGSGSPWDLWVSRLEAVRGRFASFCGASEDEVAITFCASTATSSVLSALALEGGSAYGERGRNRILVGDFDFPSLAHNFLAQQRCGAEIVRVRASGHRIPRQSYERLIDERTLLVSIPHVSFRNGYRQEVEAIAGFARAAGAYSLVDDYQSSGTRPLDVKRMGCDFLVTGSLKYLLGSSGLGFLYVRRELLESEGKLHPTATGWFGQERPFDFDVERATYHWSARRFETGTPPVPSLYAGLAGLEALGELEPAGVGSEIESLASRLLSGARERGIEVLTPEEPEHRGPLVVLGCRDAEGLVELLAREDIVVSARGSGLRVSFHYYNLPEDVDALFRVLDEHPDRIARAVERR
jgi:selenocysteine lyase/cysteine desulfurase